MNLVYKIENIGSSGFEPALFSWEEKNNNVVAVLQWLAMLKYGSDGTDFIIQTSIIRTVSQYKQKTQSSASKDLLEALIGRLASTYPEKNLEEYVKRTQPQIED